MAIITAREAKAQGKVWLTTTFSGGPNTKFLGHCSYSTKGPMDPDKAFVIFKLIQGLSFEQAQEALKEVQASHDAREKEKQDATLNRLKAVVTGPQPGPAKKPRQSRPKRPTKRRV